MRILDISQSDNTEAWLEARRGRITGTKVNALTPVLKKKRGSSIETYTLLKGWWEYVAEELAEPADGENPMERGHRLENENIQIACETLNINPATVVFDTGMWLSDDDERIAVSPDGYENSPTPTFAFEAKSLNSATHLEHVIPYLLWKGDINLDNTAEQWFASMQAPQDMTDFDFIPSQYQPQVIQYFVVNPDLEKLYFTMYDPRITSPTLAHVVMTVKRSDIDTIIAQQKQGERIQLDFISALADAVQEHF